MDPGSVSGDEISGVACSSTTREIEMTIRSNH
uniref:Uncharacterized protein n=1 Tax=Anguilla anguilla TaxID=7936 RepID=A0A0E9VUP2_ANGAN